MTLVLTSLTTFDPETSSEGTLDPLGLYLIGDQLATRLVPAGNACRISRLHVATNILPTQASAAVKHRTCIRGANRGAVNRAMNLC